jgi:hypothetical protein
MAAFKQISPILACTEDDPHYLWFECPGCKHIHGIHVGPGEGVRWTWNGSIDAPTFQPSLLVSWRFKSSDEICHSFITDGMIQYLGDCTHELANQTVPIAAWGSGD